MQFKVEILKYCNMNGKECITNNQWGVALPVTQLMQKNKIHNLNVFYAVATVKTFTLG